MFDLDCQFASKAFFVVLLINVSIVTLLGNQILFYKLKIKAFKLWKCGYCCLKIVEVLPACNFYYSNINLDKYLTNSTHTYLDEARLLLLQALITACHGLFTHRGNFHCSVACRTLQRVRRFSCRNTICRFS